MKVFLAIELSNLVKKELEKQLLEIQHEYPQFDWIPIDNYHITIHFFGDVNESKSIFQELKNILYDQESFYLYSFQADMFIKNQITMFVNFRREKHLETIAYKVKEQFSLPDQRIDRFIPHITFARFRIPSKQQYFVMKKKIHQVSIDLSFQVKKLVLFESVFGKKYPFYKKIHSIQLL